MIFTISSLSIVFSYTMYPDLACVCWSLPGSEIHLTDNVTYFPPWDTQSLMWTKHSSLLSPHHVDECAGLSWLKVGAN